MHILYVYKMNGGKQLEISYCRGCVSHAVMIPRYTVIILQKNSRWKCTQYC